MVVIRNEKKETTGIFTDGDIKRTISKKNASINNSIIKSLMTKNPISIDKDDLAAKAIELINRKKITSLCVHNKSNKKKTIGILHIHNLISAGII